jgi:hemoglobin
VAAAVEDFYARVLADPPLAPYYAGRSMRGAHLGRAVTPQAFDRVVEHLVATLTALEVPAETIEAIAAKVLPLRGDIVAPPEELGAALHAERERTAQARAALEAAERRLDEAAVAAERGRRRWLSWRRPAAAEPSATPG